MDTTTEFEKQGSGGAVESAPKTSTIQQKEFPCDWEGCTRSFDTIQGKNVHKARAHTKPWSTTANLKSKKKKPAKFTTPEYRKKSYQAMVKRYRAAGLTAQGKPFKNSAVSIGMRKAREEKELLNGATSTIEPIDNLGDSARAIIMAAQVLRAVSLGIKL